MDDLKLPIVVTLKRSITLGDETISELSFDEPDLDAQLAFIEFRDEMANPEEPTELESMLAMRFWISRLAGVSEAAAGKIKDSDTEAVNTTVANILGFVEGKDPGNGEAA